MAGSSAAVKVQSAAVSLALLSGGQEEDFIGGLRWGPPLDPVGFRENLFVCWTGENVFFSLAVFLPEFPSSAAPVLQTAALIFIVGIYA